MASRTTPRQVSVDTEAQTLAVTWDDGHRSVFPLDGLRRVCPCATCHSQRDVANTPEATAALLDDDPQRTWADVRVDTVGSYGLRITWDDGHNDGIYTWKRLRALDDARPEA